MLKGCVSNVEVNSCPILKLLQMKHLPCRITTINVRNMNTALNVRVSVTRSIKYDQQCL